MDLQLNYRYKEKARTTMDLKQLQAPFANNEIEWRVGATNAEKTTGIALAYLTNRAIQDRLDEVCGAANWKNEYAPAPAGGVLCGISIRVNDEWVTKWDGAENTDYEGVKGGLSDAMKRAAVQWGIGRYLYKADTQWVAIRQAGKSFVIAEPGKMVLKIDGKPVDGSQQTTKAERPLSPDDLVNSLRKAAEKSTKPRDTIKEQDAKNLAILMGKFIKDADTRHLFLHDVFLVESTKELSQAQHEALNRWVTSDPGFVVQEIENWLLTLEPIEA